MSLWYPERNGLRGISGAHFKQFLPKLDSDDTKWREWVRTHPSIKIVR